MDRIRTFLAGMAVAGLLTCNLAQAAEPIRSADALPVIGAAVGTVPYTEPIEQIWQCVKVTDETLGLKNKFVQVDTDGNVVINPQGDPFECTPPPGAYVPKHFPFGIFLGIGGFAGLIGGVAGGGGKNNDNGGGTGGGTGGGGTGGGGNDSPG